MPFAHIKDHVLLRQTTQLTAVDNEYTNILTNELIQNIVNLIPLEWLSDDTPFSNNTDHRQTYFQFLTTRVTNSQTFV